MRPPYSEYAAPPIYVYPAPPKRGLQFSRTEIRQLAIAILALSGAFTILFIRYDFALLQDIPTVLFLFGVSLLAVGTGVGLHELMHKFVAQRYGYWAEFRYNPQGLALAFVFALIGFIYGAPGATWISGMVTQDQNGKISAAGPGTNLAMGSAFLAGYFAVGSATSLAGTLLGFAFAEVAIVNVVLAGFNMLPVMPLDGAKVWHWNKGVYAGIVVLVLALLAVALLNGILL